MENFCIIIIQSDSVVRCFDLLLIDIDCSGVQLAYYSHRAWVCVCVWIFRFSPLLIYL